MSFDSFGFSVALDNSWLIVGAPNALAAYIYRYTNGSWEEIQVLTPGEITGSTDNFGHSVTISENIAAVSSPQNDEFGPISGASYFFVRQSNRWFDQFKITPPDGAGSDLFGKRIASNLNDFIISSPGDDAPFFESGSVYVYSVVDADQDGALDLKEREVGSDPLNPDSDGDGLFDGFEIAYGFNALIGGEEILDNDSDGLVNLAEQNALTNPVDPDTDGDGLLDGFEVNYELDPLAYTDSSTDNDQDGLSLAEEQIHGTDPSNPDTDSDGFTDGEEIENGTNPLAPNSAHSSTYQVPFPYLFAGVFAVMLLISAYARIPRRLAAHSKFPHRS